LKDVVIRVVVLLPEEHEVRAGRRGKEGAIVDIGPGAHAPHLADEGVLAVERRDPSCGPRDVTRGRDREGVRLRVPASCDERNEGDEEEAVNVSRPHARELRTIEGLLAAEACRGA
jgi:hypothetical protein